MPSESRDARLDNAMIAEQSFATARRGFDQGEVRAYLRQLSDEFDQLRRRHSDLAQRLERAETRAEQAERLDDHRLVELVGEETARVLDTARAAASDIKQKAQESASRLISEANEEAHRIRADGEATVAAQRAEMMAEVDSLRREAKAELGRRQAEAEEMVAQLRREAEAEGVALRQSGEDARLEGVAEAEAIRGEAQEVGHRLVEEAQVVRERMLRDLARRRRASREQLERLNAARDRLLAAYEVVRRTVEEATTELRVALPEAKIAGDSAMRRVHDEPEPTVDEMEAQVAMARMAGLLEPAEESRYDDVPEPGAIGSAVAEDEPTSGGEHLGRRLSGATEGVVDAGAVVDEPAPGLDAGGSGGARLGWGDGGHSSDGVDVAPPGDGGSAERASTGASDDGPDVGDVAGQGVDAGGSAGSSGRSGLAVPVTSDADDSEDGPEGGVASGALAEPEGVDEGAAGSVQGSSASGDEGSSRGQLDRGRARRRASVASAVTEAADEADESLDVGGPSDAEAQPHEGPRHPAERESPARLSAVAEELSPAEAEAEPEPGQEAEVPPEPERGEGDESQDDGINDSSLGELADHDDVDGLDSAGDSEDEPTDEQGSASEPTEPDIDELFARLRGFRDQTESELAEMATANVEVAVAVLPDPMGEPAVSDLVDPLDEPQPEYARSVTSEPASSETDDEELERVAGRAAAPGDPRADYEQAEPPLARADRPDDAPGLAVGPAEDDESLLRRRDEALAPVERSLARQLKRALVDEQNEVLDVLRRAKTVELEEILPPVAAHAARYAGAARDDLRAAVSHGAEAVNGEADVAASGEALAAELGQVVADPLRERIVRSFEESGGDVREVTDRLRSLYREWKGQRIGDAVRHYSVAAYAHGAYAAVPDGTGLRWVVDRGGDPCPDADDNALAGPVGKGEAFPTGDHCAPAHQGCRCLVLPSR
jgi:DivIVA domain-containing protein